MSTDKKQIKSDDLASNDSVISSGFFDFHDILKSSDTLELISQVEALISVRHAGKNIRLILEKVPEISERFNKVAEKLSENQKEFLLVQTTTHEIATNLQELTQKKTASILEIQKIESGQYSESDLTDLPNGITVASLQQEKIFKLFLTARNNKIKQLDSDLDLLSRKQAYNQQREANLHSKISEYQAYLTELNDAGKELVQVLKQAKTILENSPSEVSELPAARPMVQSIPAQPVRDPAEVWKEINSEHEKAGFVESPSLTTEAIIISSEKSLIQTSEINVTIFSSEQINFASTAQSESKTNFPKLMNLTQKENNELEDLLASREYNLWREKLESLEARYSEQSDSEELANQVSDSESEVSLDSNIGIASKNKPSQFSDSAAESLSNYISKTANDSSDYKVPKKRKSFWELEAKLTDASRDDIQHYSHAAELDLSPSPYELDFEKWLKKEAKHNSQPMVTRFDPIITDD